MAVLYIPEESRFLASGMDGQSFVWWELASPQLLGALTKKGPPGDSGDLEAHGQDMEGKKG